MPDAIFLSLSTRSTSGVAERSHESAGKIDHVFERLGGRFSLAKKSQAYTTKVAKLKVFKPTLFLKSNIERSHEKVRHPAFKRLRDDL